MRARSWSAVFLVVVALGLGLLTSVTACSSKTGSDPSSDPDSVSKNFTLKGKAR
jgi:hypothetical protein